MSDDAQAYLIEGRGYRVELVTGAIHYVDADEHSIEYAISDVGMQAGPAVVRFWRKTDGKRGLAAVFLLDRITFLRRA